MGIKMRKLSVERYIKERLFQSKVRELKPLLQAVQAQHGLELKGWAAVLAFGVVRRDDRDQGSPGNDTFHVGQEHLLARRFGAEVQIKAALVHGCRGCRRSLTPNRLARRFCRMSLGVVMLKTISIIFRVILFYVLLWIRVPVALILQAVTSLSAMAFVVMLIVRGWSNAIDVFWPLLAFSFGAFVLRWIYDGILMLVSPEELFMDI